MEEWVTKLLELAIGQGIWAVLYIYLFFRMLNENKSREERYQNTIDLLCENIEEGIARIKSRLEEISGSLANKKN